MPRPLRSDVSGIIYHALNRGNARNDIFFKQADDAPFLMPSFARDVEIAERTTTIFSSRRTCHRCSGCSSKLGYSRQS